MPAPIVTVTPNPVVDKIFTLEEIVPVRKLRCANPFLSPGGGGINVSRALRNLRGASRAYFFSGGSNGEHLERLLAAEGVPQRAVPIRQETRENLSFFEKNSEVHYRFVPDGPQIAPGEAARLFAALEKEKLSGGIVVGSGSVSSSMPQDFYARLIRLAHRKGARCVIDTSGAALRAVAGKDADLIKPNLRELEDFAGTKLADETAQEKAAMRLVKSGIARAMAVSLGPSGALLATPDGFRRFRAPSVKVKSPIGAGDSMTAAIALQLSRGRTLAEAVRYGVAAGSAATMTSATELCRLRDAEALHRKMRREEKTA